MIPAATTRSAVRRSTVRAAIVGDFRLIEAPAGGDGLLLEDGAGALLLEAGGRLLKG